MKIAILMLAAFAPLVDAKTWKAGLASVDISPTEPIYLNGYGNRTHPSTGVKQRLWAKALALEDEKGKRVVIVTTDLLGMPGAVSDVIASRLARQSGLRREQLMINSSHTHAAPMIEGNLATMFDLNAAERLAIHNYTEKLKDQMVDVVTKAIAELKPAHIALGHGKAGFAINRRVLAKTGAYAIGTNPQGPIDHDVPVLRITSLDGKLLGALFGYTCHNTTMGGDIYEAHGDYAGFAQQAFEKEHPGAMGMFFIQCAGDQNPNPRGKFEQAEQYGKELAGAASSVIAGKMQELNGPLRASLRMGELNFKLHTRETFEEELKDKLPAKVRRAQYMLELYDRRQPMRGTPYPVQAIRFGKQWTLVALSGEVVIDYQIRIKKEFAGEDTTVAGYSNDVMCYIPSLRVLKEGGYEADSSMIYYGKPGPFAESVEDSVMATVYKVLADVGRKRK